MLVFQTYKNRVSTNTQSDLEFKQARDYLEHKFFPSQISSFCGTYVSPTLFSLENHLNGLNSNSVPKEQRHGATDIRDGETKSYFIQTRDALTVLVRYASMKTVKSPMPTTNDSALQKFVDLLNELEQNKGLLMISNPVHYASSISMLLTIGRMYGNADLQNDADPDNFAALSEQEKSSLLYRCMQVADVVALDPGGMLLGSGYKFTDYSPLSKPDNTAYVAGQTTVFKFLGSEGPVTGPSQELVAPTLLQMVNSTDFLYPHYKQINRVYVPQWVADPEAIIANGIRSLLTDLINFGVTNNMSNDKILKFCFGDGLVFEDALTHTLVLDEIKIEKMAGNIAAHLHQQDEKKVVMPRLQNALKDGGVDIDLKTYTPYDQRATPDGNLAAFVMNYGLAESTMNLVNEYVLYPFFKAISLKKGEKNTDPNFKWSDGNYLSYLKKSLMSIVYSTDISGRDATAIGASITTDMNESHAVRIYFDKTSTGRANLAILQNVLSGAPDELAEIKDEGGNSVLLRLNDAGQIEVLEPSKIISVGSATHEPPVNVADAKKREKIMAILDSLDTNAIYYNQARTGAKIYRNPGADPQFSSNLFIRSIAGDPIVKVARSDPNDIAKFVIQESSRIVPDSKDELQRWMDMRLFCVSKNIGTKKKPQIIPDHKRQGDLLAEFNSFVSSPSMSTKTLTFDNDLQYKLTRIGGKVQIENISPIFNAAINDPKDGLFSIVTKQSDGTYTLPQSQSKQSEFVDWMAGRKIGSGEEAQEITGHPLFFKLNDVKCRYIGIGAFSPTRFGLQSEHPVYRVSRTDASVTVTFSLHNMYAPDPMLTSISGPDVHYYLDLYSPYSTKKTATIPYIPYQNGVPTTFSQNGGSFTIPLSLMPPTQYAQFSYSNGLPEPPFAPDPALYTSSGKLITGVFPFKASRHSSDVYYAMVQAQVNPQQDYASRIYTGNPLSPEFSIENVHKNAGTRIEISTDEQTGYRLLMLEPPKLEFEMSGFFKGLKAKDEKSVLTGPKPVLPPAENLVDEEVSVWPPKDYTGPAPVMGSSDYRISYSPAMEKNKKAVYDAVHQVSLENFNQSLLAQGGPRLSADEFAELTREGHLNVGGADGYHLWVERSVSSPSVGTTHTISFCNQAFYTALRIHVHNGVLAEQSEHDITTALRTTLNILPSDDVWQNVVKSTLQQLVGPGRGQISESKSQAVLQALAPVNVFNATKMGQVIEDMVKNNQLTGEEGAQVHEALYEAYIAAMTSAIDSLTDKTLSSLRRSPDMLGPGTLPNGQPKPPALVYIASSKTHFLQLTHTQNGLVIHPGRLVKSLTAYDAGDPANNILPSGSIGYVSVSGEGLGIPIDYPYRIKDKSGQYTNDIPLSGVPMALCLVGVRGQPVVSPGKKANSYVVNQNLVLLSADGQSKIDLSFEGNDGNVFTVQKNETTLEFSLPISVKLGGDSRRVGLAYYTYNRNTGQCTMDRYEAEPEFVQFLVKFAKDNPDRKVYYQSVKLDEYGSLNGTSLHINTEYGRPFVSGGIDWSRKGEISERLLPYLSSLAPWAVGVPAKTESGAPKLDENGLQEYNDYGLHTRVEFPGSDPNKRTLILSYPRDGKPVDYFRIYQDGNDFRVEPLRPDAPEFEKFLKDVFEGTFGSPTSMLDEEYLLQVPTRFGSRGPFA